LLPFGAEALIRNGHQVFVQKGAGAGAGLDDEAYAQVGAGVVETPEEIFATSGMMMKVKEPQKQEIPLMREGQIMFTYFHFAASRELTLGVRDSGAVAVAYETLVDRRGSLPLLTPMSEIAGRMSIQQGAKFLEKPQGGRGILLSGIPGVPPAHVMVLGGGVVGTNAAKMAAGLGAHVIIVDNNLDRLRYLGEVMSPNVVTLFSTRQAILDRLPHVDLVVGAVLLPGAKAPWLVHREDLQLMPQGSVIVDVAIDQGGCVETSRPTSHSKPVFVEDGILHYCVGNMPGAVPRTATFGLCNATFPWAMKLANEGVEKATQNSPELATAMNIDRGAVVHPAVAETFDLPFDDRYAK
jgi:alanine dehydrogenase